MKKQQLMEQITEVVNAIRKHRTSVEEVAYGEGEEKAIKAYRNLYSKLIKSNDALQDAYALTVSKSRQDKTKVERMIEILAAVNARLAEVMNMEDEVLASL